MPPTPTPTHPKVDAFLARQERWQAEMAALRGLCLGAGLHEDLKWGQPCYGRDGRNVVLIHGFKEYCALLFFKGALMKDPRGLLIQQTENVQAARQIRFQSLAEVKKRAPALKGYLKDAVAVELSGAKVAMKRTADFAVPAEFQAQLDAQPRLKKAFEALTPGRQRAYLHFFNGAKKSETRAERVAKHSPRILAGKGLDD